MVDLCDAEIRAAKDRGSEMLEREPHAVSALHGRETGRAVVELANDCTFIIPVQLAEELHGADNEALFDVKVDGAGFSLHWFAIDADLYVPSLVAGVFGTRAWMAKEWARMAGRSKTSGQGRSIPGEWRQRGRTAQSVSLGKEDRIPVVCFRAVIRWVVLDDCVYPFGSVCMPLENARAGERWQG